MATRDEVYAKFGITAEAAQLFETELGTLLLCARGLRNGWHVTPDGERAQAALNDINRSTLGRLLTTLKKHIDLGDDLEDRFASALQARNRLNHGFFEKHNFRIQTDEGRDAMLADLESLHDELFNAWQIASAMTTITAQAVEEAHAENDV
ncbi:hypothetical protein [Chelativorans xinjiangense]|uniref:hypothetical protein n=1 Tax=Chelativorans xinjiangense TaxID=2681485 RepID=UPI001357306C|nr:hypothetical protein [Chelativorans xinjiangense]